MLVKKLLGDLDAWSHLYLDSNPFVVGHVEGLTKNDGKEWFRYLNAVQKRKNLGAVLLVLDGDADSIRKEKFCAKIFGTRLANWATSVGAGNLFSVACVFACQEFESWIVACADRLAGKRFTDGREGFPDDVSLPAGDLEHEPRNAKGWLAKQLPGGYKVSTDQELLTKMIVEHLDAPRLQAMRSFRRLQNALKLLSEAAQSGKHITSPAQL